MKTWIAYLLPHPTDVFNLLEDGIQWIEAGDSKAQAEANLRRKFDEQMEDESYSAEEANKIWKDHHSYVQEIEETEEDTEKTTRLTHLAMRFYEEIELPTPRMWAALFDALATRDELTLEALFNVSKGEQQ